MLFRPTIQLTLVLLLLAAVFLRLGLWQLERKHEKERLFERFENAPALSLEQALREKSMFARVEARGRYDPNRHLLLDNRIHQGRAGVHVLTPFFTDQGDTLLVNRGWLPMAADRRSLPLVPGDAQERVIHGILNRPSTGGQRLGEADIVKADDWPQLVTYLDLDAVSLALGTPLEPWLLQLDAGDESGFQDRQWQPAVMEPKVHGAYAVQWFGLAAAACVIWVLLGLKRARALAARAEVEQ